MSGKRPTRRPDDPEGLLGGRRHWTGSGAALGQRVADERSHHAFDLSTARRGGVVQPTVGEQRQHLIGEPVRDYEVHACLAVQAV